MSDDALKPRVEQALRADPAVQDSQIAVPSINQGVVRLAGLETAMAARATPGVRAVRDDLRLVTATR